MRVSGVSGSAGIPAGGFGALRGGNHFRRPPVVVVLVTAAASALGAAVAQSSRYTVGGCAVLLAFAILLSNPPVGLIVVLAIAGVMGNAGAHIAVGGLPVMECLLALACAAAILRAIAPEWPQWTPVMWMLPAAWGLAQLLLRNRGNLVSGVREALIFIYPLMFALPLMGLRSDQIRRFLMRRAHYICLVGWIVVGIGAYNLLTGKAGATSSGQLRALGSWYAEPLMAAFLASLWLHETGRWSTLKALIGATPIMGLLLVNHRSAYLGAIAVALALVLLRAGVSTRGRGLGRLALIGAVGAAIFVVATPVGQSGISRFQTITSSSDPNIQDRLLRDQLALPKTASGWIIGAGVGLTPTSITGEDRTNDPTNANQTHDSFAAMLHLGGLIGLALVVAPLIWVIGRSLPARDDPLVQVLLALILFTAVMAGFNVVLENAYFGGWLWASVLLLEALALRPGSAGRRRLGARPPAAADGRL